MDVYRHFKLILCRPTNLFSTPQSSYSLIMNSLDKTHTICTLHLLLSFDRRKILDFKIYYRSDRSIRRGRLREDKLYLGRRWWRTNAFMKMFPPVIAQRVVYARVARDVQSFNIYFFVYWIHNFFSMNVSSHSHQMPWVRGCECLNNVYFFRQYDWMIGSVY